ncbi:ribokinase [Rhodopirellula sp. MGV]|uniref:ribokinase n=1 Tax=Rhodopirellula sp. MGV TaxID=2023130 RepID=UPI000B9683D8|nr:ribokinase [Rhodopirellula sp. MGV]OYP39184.1 ribokinase [Rhodopirellula sp. MGV]PNY35439.1 ribokinase [Rhodopirellula baltica]
MTSSQNSDLTATTSRRPKIAVLGSINMDLVVRCAKLPTPGQTISAGSFDEIPGGKGANQAVAAVRAGGEVHMIGRVGDDGFGNQLLQHLENENVNCDGVQVTGSSPSGVAIVAVERSGENSIIVVPGANGQVTVDDVIRHGDLIRQSDVLMVQLETPFDAVEAAIQVAKESGVKVILDPAPAITLPPTLLNVDVICPNESEAAILTGRSCDNIEQAKKLAERLHELGAAIAIITMGEVGTVVHDGTQTMLIESHRIEAVDTTAAGDAFAGTLAVRLAMGLSLPEAIRFANVAGALAASVAGAQPSLPTAAQVEQIAALNAQRRTQV